MQEKPIDRSYYSLSPLSERGIQQDCANIVCSWCNAIAIFQNAYYHEHHTYAAPAIEIEVLSALLTQRSNLGAAGLPADRSSAYVASHALWLAWLMNNRFLTKRHEIYILHQNEIVKAAPGHYVARFTERGSSDSNHFVNCEVQAE